MDSWGDGDDDERPRDHSAVVSNRSVRAGPSVTLELPDFPVPDSFVDEPRPRRTTRSTGTNPFSDVELGTLADFSGVQQADVGPPEPTSMLHDALDAVRP